MQQSTWQKSGCVLCAQNCGLEVWLEDNHITRVRPDKDNPRSRGYACRKGMSVAHYQHHGERLTTPLKKTAAGFVPISWEQACTEIGERLKGVVTSHGSRSFAYMGGGGQGCHFEAAFGLSLLRGLGSHYHYNALAQELTGYFWVCGRMLGRQNRFPIADEGNAEMLLAVGWNGMVSHQMARAPLVLKEFAANPAKKLVVVDPRRSETAAIANLHLAVRPGCDALLWRAVIALLLARGLVDEERVRRSCTGFDEIRPWFTGIDVDAALALCQLQRPAVETLVEDLATRRWCLHFDLGIHMNRHSTLSAYLLMLLAALCGRIGAPGGQVVPGALMPLGSHSDERKAETWRTVASDFFPICGVFPPNVMPEEIESDSPERLRAVLCSSANPLRSYADSGAYERAFANLDLLVVIELAMTETARLADYVLPARSGYECHNGTFFSWTWPEIYFQMRRPLLQPQGEAREGSAIITAIARAAGLLPELPQSLYHAAGHGLAQYEAALVAYLAANRKSRRLLPLILAETLGPALGSSNLAALWGLVFAMPEENRLAAERVGFARPGRLRALFGRHTLPALRAALTRQSLAPLLLLSPGAAQSRTLFQAILDHPEGLIIGRADEGLPGDHIRHCDGKVHLHIEELASWMAEITPQAEEVRLALPEDFPLILQAGQHTRENANTLMRDPLWNQGRRACTLRINPGDAEPLGIADGDLVLVTTASGRVSVAAEVTALTRPGQVLLPHGFGLFFQGTTHGANVNLLTSAGWRDRLAATPYHKYVPCRVEKALSAA